MLLIFVPKLTNRAGYTINVVMRDLLQTDFAITTAPLPTMQGRAFATPITHWKTAMHRL